MDIIEDENIVMETVILAVEDVMLEPVFNGGGESMLGFPYTLDVTLS